VAISRIIFFSVRPERVGAAATLRGMADSAHYRAEALRFLQWAEAAFDPEVARRWRRLADDFVSLAEQLEPRESGRPAILPMPMQAQPMQQQQAKLENDDSTDC